MGNGRRPTTRAPEKALRLIVLAAADRDLGDALDWSYTRYGPHVATGLLDRFDAVCRRLTLAPGIGTPTRDGARGFPLRRFPYTLVYRVTDTAIQVVALRHQSRKPRP